MSKNALKLENIKYLNNFGNSGNTIDYKLTNLIESHKKLKTKTKKQN